MVKKKSQQNKNVSKDKMKPQASSKKKTSRRAKDKAQDIQLVRAGSADLVIEELNKKLGGGVAQKPTIKPIIVTPSGILSMDLAVGNGGLIGGRIMDIHGWEGTGKTLACMTIGAYIQRCTKIDHNGDIVNKIVAFLDAEGTFSKQFAESAGMNTNDLILVQSTPEKIMTGEDFFDAMILCLQMDVDYIILDSCPALVPSQVFINDIGQGQKATTAQLMSEGVKKASSLAAATGHSLVHFVNQIRGKPMATKWEKSEIETGGNALKFYSSYRFDVVSHEEIRKKVLGIDGSFREKRVGVNSRIKIIKNKTAPIPPELPSTNYHFDFDVYFDNFRDEDGIEYMRGVDVVKDYVETGIRTGVVKQASSWFSFGSLNENGKAALINKIKERPEIMNEIRAEVFNAMGMIDGSGMTKGEPVAAPENVIDTEESSQTA